MCHNRFKDNLIYHLSESAFCSTNISMIISLIIYPSNIINDNHFMDNLIYYSSE